MLSLDLVDKRLPDLVHHKARVLVKGFLPPPLAVSCHFAPGGFRHALGHVQLPQQPLQGSRGQGPDQGAGSALGGPTKNGDICNTLKNRPPVHVVPNSTLPCPICF